MALSDGQIERYSRQIIVPRVGGRAQERLLSARIAIVGDSRDLAAPLAYLAAAGVGTLAPIVTDGASAAPRISIRIPRSTRPARRPDAPRSHW
jgi:molybdopterin/thiamine biosynthesis adenylyltransferase